MIISNRASKKTKMIIKSYRQIERESKKGQLKKVGRLFRISRFNLDEKLSEWKLKRMRAKALKFEKNELYTFRRPSESVSNTENGSLPEKSKIQNLKSQINHNIKTQNSKCFENLKIRILNLFRICNFEFVISKTKYFFKTLKSRIILKKSLALITILAVIVTAYWQNVPQASGATETV